MKLCRNCKHFNESATGFDSQCHADGNMDIDYVDGGAKWNYSTAQGCRHAIDMCGPNAKWFDQRPYTTPPDTQAPE